MNRFSQILLDSPGWKTVFSAVLPILAGVLSGAFVAEISTAQGLDWPGFYKAWSFYGLAGLIVVIYAYNRAVYHREIGTTRFSDVEFCVAYMRSKCLPEAAERYKEMIRDGKGGELAHIMSEVKESLK